MKMYEAEMLPEYKGKWFTFVITRRAALYGDESEGYVDKVYDEYPDRSEYDESTTVVVRGRD